MVWLKMFFVAWRLAWPYVLTPWRSPLLRWRMETYGIVGADGTPLGAGQVTANEFCRFVCRNRSALARFLRWAATL